MCSYVYFLRYSRLFCVSLKCNALSPFLREVLLLLFYTDFLVEFHSSNNPGKQSTRQTVRSKFPPCSLVVVLCFLLHLSFQSAQHTAATYDI